MLLEAPQVPEEIASLSLGQVIGILLFVSAIIGGIVTVGRKVRPFVILVRNFLDDWNGTPQRPGVEERPGVMERLASLESGLEEVRHELKPNNGNSLVDKVDRIETATGAKDYK